MSGFKELPNQEQVGKYDPRYISDMKLAMHLYSHQHNNSPVMKMYEQWEAFNENPDAYKLHAEENRAMIERERIKKKNHSEG